MSWSFSCLGKPAAVAAALERYGGTLSGYCKEEFDAAKEFLVGLVQQNFADEQSGYKDCLLDFEASGSGSKKGDKDVQRTCSVSIKPTWKTIVGLMILLGFLFASPSFAADPPKANCTCASGNGRSPACWRPNVINGGGPVADTNTATLLGEILANQQALAQTLNRPTTDPAVLTALEQIIAGQSQILGLLQGRPQQTPATPGAPAQPVVVVEPPGATTQPAPAGPCPGSGCQRKRTLPPAGVSETRTPNYQSSAAGPPVGFQRYSTWHKAPAR